MNSWIWARDKVSKRTLFDFRNAFDVGVILLLINTVVLISMTRGYIFNFILLFYIYPIISYCFLINKTVKFNELVECGRLIICQIEKQYTCYKAMYRSKRRTMYCSWFDAEKNKTLLFRADNMIYYLNGKNRSGENIDEILHVYVMFDSNNPKKYYVFHDELIMESSTFLEGASSSSLLKLLFGADIILLIIVCGVIWIGRKNIIFSIF